MSKLHQKVYDEFMDLPEFIGIAYRAETGFSNRDATVKDVIDFECNELENHEDFAHLSVWIRSALAGVPAYYAKWVTKTEDEALPYGEPDEIFYSEPGVVLAEDGDGGYLVLENEGVHMLVDALKEKLKK